MKITQEQFFEKYKPIQNPFTKESGWNNTMFETYGQELHHVTNSEFADAQIWTLVSGPNENCYIIPGYHFIDVIGFFITEIPWTDKNIEVNCNDMLNREQAVDACYTFWKIQGFEFDINRIERWFDKEEYSTGEAKYLAIDFYDDITRIEMTQKQEDNIHDYYSNLI